MTGPRTAALRQHILHQAALSAVHGAGLARALADAGIPVSPGTLYPLLHRLAADGLLTARNQVVDGRARRVYQATDAGRAALGRLAPPARRSA